MAAHTPPTRRPDDAPVIVVPGRETTGVRRARPVPPPSNDAGRPVAHGSGQRQPRSPRHQRGLAVAALGGTVGVVALSVGLIALTAPGAVRSVIGWATSALGHESAEPTPSPSASGLDPELAGRVEAARAAAAAEGVELTITSGWRTVAQQQALVDEALERYGTPEEAHRWVAPAETSAHVLGRAVDIGPTEGAYWLQEHGSRYGLCQVFANEVWHFEATVEPGSTCPALVPDASGLWS